MGVKFGDTDVHDRPVDVANLPVERTKLDGAW